MIQNGQVMCCGGGVGCGVLGGVSGGHELRAVGVMWCVSGGVV